MRTENWIGVASPGGQADTVIHVEMSDVEWIVRCGRLTYTRCATASDAVQEARALAALVTPSKIVIVLGCDEVTVETYSARPR